MGPAPPPALLVLESCPLRGGPRGRVRERRKWARMRAGPEAAAVPRGRAATEARRDHHSQHSRRLPAPAPSDPAVPLCRLPVLSLEWPGDKGAPEGCSFRLGDLRRAGWRGQRLPGLSPSPAAPEACPDPRHTAEAAGAPALSRRVAQPSRPRPALPPTTPGFRPF